jgi:hypothetical protein
VVLFIQIEHLPQMFGQKRGTLRRLRTLKPIGGAHDDGEQPYLRHTRFQSLKFGR